MHAGTSILLTAALWVLSLGANATCYTTNNDCSGANSQYRYDGGSPTTPSISSQASDQAKAAAAASALEAIGTFLDKQGERENEQARQAEQLRSDQDRAEAERQRQQNSQTQRNYQSLDSFEASMGNDDWQSRATAASSTKGSSTSKKPAQTSSTGDCNCREEAGICKATVVVVKKRPTGADFRVTSSAPRCSKVSYYIDSTPMLTVLNNTNSAMEHAAGLTEITNKTFEVESCKVCASK
jgi:hypothetical protein